MLEGDKIDKLDDVAANATQCSVRTERWEQLRYRVEMNKQGWDGGQARPSWAEQGGQEMGGWRGNGSRGMKGGGLLDDLDEG